MIQLILLSFLIIFFFHGLLLWRFCLNEEGIYFPIFRVRTGRERTSSVNLISGSCCKAEYIVPHKMEYYPGFPHISNHSLSKSVNCVQIHYTRILSEFLFNHISKTGK